MDRWAAVPVPHGFGEDKADEHFVRGMGAGAKVSPSHLLVPSLLGKASSKAKGHSCERIQSVVLEVTMSVWIMFYLLNQILFPAGCFPFLSHCKSNCLEIPSIKHDFLFISFLLFSWKQRPRNRAGALGVLQCSPWRPGPDMYLSLSS